MVLTAIFSQYQPLYLYLLGCLKNSVYRRNNHTVYEHTELILSVTDRITADAIYVFAANFRHRPRCESLASKALLGLFFDPAF